MSINHYSNSDPKKLQYILELIYQKVIIMKCFFDKLRFLKMYKKMTSAFWVFNKILSMQSFCKAILASSLMHDQRW